MEAFISPQCGCLQSLKYPSTCSIPSSLIHSHLSLCLSSHPAFIRSYVGDVLFLDRFTVPKVLLLHRLRSIRSIALFFYPRFIHSFTFEHSWDFPPIISPNRPSISIPFILTERYIDCGTRWNAGSPGIQRSLDSPCDCFRAWHSSSSLLHS